ncbi:DNA polymerase III subunit gamma/tau [Natronospora cellulosivora (SeqCode)]
MAFLSLYRKYRPNNFNDLVGQRHVVRTLKNALEHDRIAHAYLFAGPRGTGKTSTAKIYAQALNCAEGPTMNPCGHCETCQKIQTGQSIDVIEIDAASNRGIDEIRDLREKVKFYPSEGKYKVYIIDEVHMLTSGAFNALLKTLEEPPANVVFILATTEPHKVIDTILSRCQRFDFTLMSSEDINSRLEHICKQEGVEYDQGSLNLITAASNGGLRDAISLLDQAISFTNAKLKEEEIQEMLGKVELSFLKDFLENIINKNTPATLEMLNDLINSGKGISVFINDLIKFLRQIMLVKECGKNSSVFTFSDNFYQTIEGLIKEFSSRVFINFLEILTKVDKELAYSDQPRILLEMAVIKMATASSTTTIEELNEKVDRLENKLKHFEQSGTGFVKKSSNTENVNNGLKKEPFNKKSKLDEKDYSAETSRNASKDSKREAIASKVNNDFDSKDDNKQLDNNDKLDIDKNDVQEDIQSNESKHDNSTGLNIEKVRDSWPDIMQRLRSENVSVQALFLEGEPVGVEGDIVYIQFPTDKNFHRKGAEKNSAIIQKVISSVLGVLCKVKIISSGEDIGFSKKKLDGINDDKLGINHQVDNKNSSMNKNTSLDNNENNANDANKDLDIGNYKKNDSKDDSDVLKKVLRVFNGQVIKVNHKVLEKKEK